MSYMKAIAELFGVKFNEQFAISKGSAVRYWLTEDGMWTYDNVTNSTCYCPRTLSDILSSDTKIIKLLPLPKKGDTYFYINPFEFKNSKVIKAKWSGTYLDYVFYKLGNVFFNKEIAEENIESFKKMLTNTNNFAEHWRKDYETN